jgi:FG-GAP-like repeat/Cep192 domain 4/Protein of unknown function (DUF1573)/Abnormal spindle-like microcephaly-assoc'd, ASPM-SPD-2-Hydin
MVRKSVLPVRSYRSSSLFILAILVAASFLWAPSAAAQTYLYGVASYSAGNSPVAVVTADLNGDGQLDIAVANRTDSTISVFLSQPNGTLAAGVTYNVGSGPVALAAADFNGDGHPDLATANEGSRNVSVLINNGDGTFQAAATYAAGYEPNSIAAADFNADGKMDLAVSNFGDNTVSVLLGNGDGTFQNQQVTLVGTGPKSLLAGDFNNDGKSDLVVGDSANGQSALTLLLSNGDGTFTRSDWSVNYPGSGGMIVANTLAAGDFNNDGNLDVVVAGPYEQGGSSVLLGNGDGTFQTPIEGPSVNADAIAAVDINHDGKLDLVVLSGGIETFFGNGDGTFQQPVFSYANLVGNGMGFIGGMAVADMNGDGQSDAIIAPTFVGVGNLPVLVALGNPDGTFAASPSFSLSLNPLGGPTFAATADFNGDGKPDIAMIQPESLGPAPEVISVLLSKGDGTFQTFETTNVPGGGLNSLVTGDFNGDGKMDVAGSTTVGSGATVSVFLGNGDGTFQSPIDSNLPLSATPIASGDFNGDGKTDLVVTSFDVLRDDLSVQILLSNGDGTFTPGAQLDIAPRPATIQAIQVGDFSKDGKLDVAVASGDAVYVFLGNGNGTFTGPAAYTVNFTNPLAGFAVGDFNGDGNPDLAVSAENLGHPVGVAVLPGTGTGTFGAPIYTSDVGFQTAVAGDFNNDGKIDLATSQSSLLLGSGDGTFTLSNISLVSGPVATADFNSDGIPDLAIGDGNSNGVALVYLSAAVVNLAPSPVNFGDVSVGQSSPPVTVTLTNLGIVSIPSFNFSTTGDFSQTNTCTGSLAVSAQCQIAVTFTPTAPGLRKGSVVIADNALPNPQMLGLSGTGEASSVSFSPTTLNFNVQEVGTNSAPHTVTLTNSGNQPLAVGSVTASANYSETNTCTASPIQPNGNCTITVTFSPTTAGPLNGTITVTDNANNQAGSQQTVPLTGTGSTTAVYLSTGSLAFGSQSIGTTSSPQPVMLTNAGTSPVTISAITVSANFSETNNCTAPLAAGKSCTVQVSFAPTAPGTLNGTLTVTFNAPGSPETVTLSGTGTGAVASLSPTSVTFPGQLVGSHSAASKVTLTNTGTTALAISKIATSGDFSESNSCPKSLNINQSCAMSVTFSPTQGGSRSGTLTVTDNATGSPQKVMLTGTGQDFTLAIASGSSTSQSVSPGGTATYTLSTAGLGGLNASIAFTCTGAPAKSTCSVSPATLTPGNTATAVTVTVTTQAASLTAPWFEQTPPLNGTTKLLLLAVAGMLLAGLWLGTRGRLTSDPSHHAFRIRLLALPVLLLLLALGATACGGGNGMGSNTIPGTTAGTYSLTLTGTATVNSQVLTHNVPLTLTVK